MFEISFHDEIAIIELAHGKVNAFDVELCDALITKLAEIVDSACPAVILSSQTEGVFSAGIDLKRWLAEGPEYVRPYMNSLEQLFEAIFCFPKPIVADINGAAIAGGCMVATACDYRVIQPDAKIGILESRLGVALPMMAIEIMRHVALPHVFRHVTSIGATYMGQRAVNAGLADEVSDESRSAAIEVTKQLTSIPLPAFELTKRQRTLPVMSVVHENRKQLLESYMEIWESDDTRNAIRKYVAQRLN